MQFYLNLSFKNSSFRASFVQRVKVITVFLKYLDKIIREKDLNLINNKILAIILLQIYHIKIYIIKIVLKMI